MCKSAIALMLTLSALNIGAFAAEPNQSYEVTVPAALVPGATDYVKLEGVLSNELRVNVEADDSVILTNSIDGKTKTLGVHFDGISELGDGVVNYDESQGITIDNITNALFGTWSGSVTYRITAEIEHMWDEGNYTIDLAPTCTETGLESIHCLRCEEIKDQRVVKALGHDLTDTYVITKEPTCTENGLQAFVCERAGCTYKYNESIVSASHKWSDTKVVTKEPTCTENGARAYVCTVDGCGATREGETISASHTWTANKVVVDPTCTTDGYAQYECTVAGCGAVRDKTVTTALGHSYIDTGKDYRECERCGTPEHLWEQVVTLEATCTTDGTYMLKCKNCGEEQTDDSYIIKGGHILSDTVQIIQEPTCTENGLQAFVCTRGCGYTYNVTSVSASHKWSDTREIIQEPTCTEQGKSAYVCTVDGCDANYNGVWVDALGHNYVDGVCTRCGDGSANPILDFSTGPKACEHNYEESFPVDATCTTDGYTPYICTLCGDEKHEDIVPAYGHAFESSITIEAKCETDGLTTKTCTCGETEEEVIEATGHSMIDGVCEDCGYTEASDELPIIPVEEPEEPVVEEPVVTE